MTRLNHLGVVERRHSGSKHQKRLGIPKILKIDASLVARDLTNVDCLLQNEIDVKRQFVGGQPTQTDDWVALPAVL